MSARLEANRIDLRSVSEEARAWLDNLGNDLSRNTDGVRVYNALQDLSTALEAIIQAKSKAVILSTDPRYNADYKLKQVKALVGDSYDAATSAAATLGITRKKALDALTRKMLPSKPSGADSAMLAFQAGEASKVLEAAGSSTACINTVGSMLADALAKGDDLLVYILAGGVLDLTYRRLISSQAMLQQKIAETLASAQAKPVDANAAGLLPALKDGGSDTLAGLATKAQYAVGNDRQAYERWLSVAARDGQLNGVWEGGTPNR